MSKIIDKSLILNRIKSHYKLSSNSKLARFLGINTNTLANWYTRNTINYDLILTKCDDLNPNWLFTGRGQSSPKYVNLEEMPPLIIEDQQDAQYGIDKLHEDIERLNKIISTQQETINAQAKTIEVMDKLINAKSHP